MAREQEIQKLIDEENGIDNYGSSDYQIGVCDGVRIADKTMIEKVCKWLKENANDYLDWYDWEECRLNTDNLLYDFKKAMGE